jgi:hypothetical protein
MPDEARFLRVAQIAQIDIDRPEFVVRALAIPFQASKGHAERFARTAERPAGDAKESTLG